MKKIFVNENLTNSRKFLLWKTRQIADQKNVKYVWTINGKILTRKTDLATVETIETENDLQKLWDK